MSYIVVWRHRHRDPHVSTDTHDFLETYSTYEEAAMLASTCCANGKDVVNTVMDLRNEIDKQ